MPKVSVVVPVYGVEKYIERCARSLFEQTLDDIEFIFVDDCTPDRSIEVLNRVLDEYPKRIPQTIILHHEVNKGLPQARKTGIESATGEYIAHCDSDDWLDLNLYEVVYNQAIELQSDIIAFNCKHTDGESTLEILPAGTETVASECIIKMMHRKMWWSLCNKIIKRDLYNNKQINYPTDGMGEDMCLTLQLMYECKSISYNYDVYYNYYQNPKSIIQVHTIDNCLSKFQQICRNIDKVKQYYSDKPKSDGIRNGLRYLEYNAKFPLLPLLNDKKYYHLWRNSFKGCEWVVAKDKNAILKERIRAIFIMIGLYPLPRNKYSNLIQ